MNLLEETIKCLKENGLSEKDIVWVGSPRFYFDFKDFKKIADVEYDNDYGSAKVAEDLLIVGKDWWLKRHEYDGSEWWAFKSIPQKPQKKVKIKALTVGQAENLGFDITCGWESLSNINNIKE